MVLPAQQEELERLLEEAMNQNKPHLIETEKRLQKLPFGRLIATFENRAGVTVKTTFSIEETWLKDKR